MNRKSQTKIVRSELTELETAQIAVFMKLSEPVRIEPDQLWLARKAGLVIFKELTESPRSDIEFNLEYFAAPRDWILAHKGVLESSKFAAKRGCKYRLEGFQ